MTQREWLTEDLAQIRRYFPDAELIETLDTPFDIQVSLKKAAIKPVRSAGASEKRAGECGLSASEATLAPEGRRASLQELEALAGCVSWGVLL